MGSEDHPIKQMMQFYGLSYRELSEFTGINWESLCRYANYKKTPRPANCYKIIDYANSRGYSITLEDLLRRK